MREANKIDNKNLYLGIAALLAIAFLAAPYLLVPQSQSVIDNCNLCTSNNAMLTNARLGCEAAGWQCSVTQSGSGPISYCLSCSQTGIGTCKDTDTSSYPSKQLDIKGTVSVNVPGKTYTSSDCCSDSAGNCIGTGTTFITEFYCSDMGSTSISQELVNCADSGSVCQGGRCVKSESVVCSPGLLKKVCENGCQGNQQCLLDGTWGKCVQDDPSCGASTTAKESNDYRYIYMVAGLVMVCIVFILMRGKKNG